MEIQCPTSGAYVFVSGSGSGSGGGTICVRGVLSDQDNGDPGSGSSVVRVRILSGHVPPPPLPPPEPKEPGDVDTVPVGQAWCAQNVPVPGSTGVAVTAVAWLQTNGQWLMPHSVPFYAGGPDPIDCCAACAPKESAAPPAEAFAAWPPPPPPLPPL